MTTAKALKRDAAQAGSDDNIEAGEGGDDEVGKNDN